MNIKSAFNFYGFHIPTLNAYFATGWIQKMEESDFGIKYIIEGPIDSPDGRNPEIITVWIIEKGGRIPRLITAYPIGRREK